MSRLDRQSFLGAASEETLARLTVGLVGLGGGGSHVAQQLAHVGVGNFVLVDPDIVEDTNLNRLVGGALLDALQKRLKVLVAMRVIKGVNPKAKVTCISKPWQQALHDLKPCDIVVGGLDSVLAKDELDRFCRRQLVPYIDMGMDVNAVGDHFLIAGQVAMSSPGCPCLRCFGIVTDDALGKEAARYGAAGSKPQVVWPNGVLASLAVGMVTQLATPWHRGSSGSAYLEFDGNANTVRHSDRLKILQGVSCPHHVAADVGDMRFDIRKPADAAASAEAVEAASSWAQAWKVALQKLGEAFRALTGRR